MNFLAKQNGARLFLGALDIYGVLQPGQLLSRKGVDSLLPFNIESMNSERSQIDLDRFLAVGTYGFNGSSVCMERRNGGVSLFSRTGGSPLASWRDLEHWIDSEISRLSLLFDVHGRRLVDESETIPFGGT